MQEMIEFIEYLLPSVCQFLLTEPINYFTGICILFAVVGLINRIINRKGV